MEAREIFRSLKISDIFKNVNQKKNRRLIIHHMRRIQKRIFSNGERTMVNMTLDS